MNVTLKKYLDGLNSWLFEKVCNIMGAKHSEKVGLTCDDSMFLDSLPQAYPNNGVVCGVSLDMPDVDFVVVKTDKDKNTVTIREIDGEIEYDIGVDVYDLLFVTKPITVKL